MKKIYSLLLAFIMSSSILFFGACSNKNEAKAPVYKDNGEFFKFMAWGEPIDTLEDYKICKDMGITDILYKGTYANRLGFKEPTDFAKVDKCMEYCKELGLNVTLDSGGTGHLGYTWPKDLEYDWSKYPVLNSIMWWDEPTMTCLEYFNDTLAKTHEKLFGKGKNIQFTADISTVMSNANWMNGYTDVVTGKTYVGYKEILKNLQSQGIDVSLMSSFYPIRKEYDTGKYYLGDKLYNIESQILLAKELGIEAKNMIMLSQGHDNAGQRLYPDMTKEDMTFQAYTNLAFGMNEFTLFQYNSRVTAPGWGDACVDAWTSGVINKPYWNCKNMIEEVNSIAHIYKQFEWVSAMPVYPYGTLEEDKDVSMAKWEEIKPWEAIEGVKPLTTVVNPRSIERIKDGHIKVTQNTIASSFVDKNGQDMIMLVNYTIPEEMLIDHIKLELKDATKCDVYIGGKKKTYVLDKGVLSLTLNPGEGAMLLPY